MKRVLIRSVFLLAVLVISTSALSYAADKRPGILGEGDVVTEFVLKDALSGEEVSFDKDIKGKSKVIGLCFFTTTCGACKAQLSLMSDLAKKYGEEDLLVYAVSVDINGEKTLPVYSSDFKFNVRYLLDPDFSVPMKFGFSYTPSLVIADSDGLIYFKRGGFTSNNDSEDIIGAVLKAIKKK